MLPNPSKRNMKSTVGPSQRNPTKTIAKPATVNREAFNFIDLYRLNKPKPIDEKTIRAAVPPSKIPSKPIIQFYT